MSRLFRVVGKIEANIHGSCQVNIDEANLLLARANRSTARILPLTSPNRLGILSRLLKRFHNNTSNDPRLPTEAVAAANGVMMFVRSWHKRLRAPKVGMLQVLTVLTRLKQTLVLYAL